MQPECKLLHSGIVFEEFASGDPHKIRGYARMQKLHSGILGGVFRVYAWDPQKL